MLLLERYSEAVNNGAEYLEQLPYPVVSLRFVDEPVEDVAYRSSYEGPVAHELPVYPVQYGLEVVALPGVLGVEELHEVQAEVLVDVLLGHLGVDLGADDEPEEELVDHLEVGPARLQHRLVLLRVEVVRGGRQRPADVVANADHQVLHYALREDLLPGGRVHVIHQLKQRLPLQVLTAQVRLRIVKAVYCGAQVQLFYEEGLFISLLYHHYIIIISSYYYYYFLVLEGK